MIQDEYAFNKNTELLAQYQDGADPNSPRKLERHSNGKGTIIHFDMYGKYMKMFVPDAQYRPDGKIAYGMYDKNIPELQHFDQDAGYMYGSSVSKTDPLPNILNDNQLQSKFPSFRADKTAKENTDILMKYSDTPAAHAARNVNVGLGPMNLPNIYECMVMYQEADTLDAMDPTFNNNKVKGLGRTSTYGRFDWLNGSGIWSSTSYSDSLARYVVYYGYVNYFNRDNAYGVVPVLEL